MMDYRYSCWDRFIPFLTEFQPNNPCKFILYFLLCFITIILTAISFDFDPGQNAENIMVIALFLSGILSICNYISLMVFFSIIICIIIGSIYVELMQSIDELHINKFIMYSFPLILSLTLFYALICCRNGRINKIYYRVHVGFNVLCALLSILNRSTNVIVFCIWLFHSNIESTGWPSIFQLFLVIITATISTIFVEYKTTQNNNNNAHDQPLSISQSSSSINNNINNAHNNNYNNNPNQNVNTQNMYKLHKYFCLGKIFTFMGWGRLWFEMATWDRNIQRDNIINGYHAIKLYELIFESFPSLALQVIITINTFIHETVIISIIITIIYITLTIIGIVYDDQYINNGKHRSSRDVAFSTSTSSTDRSLRSGAGSSSIQASSGMINDINNLNQTELEIARGSSQGSGAQIQQRNPIVIDNNNYPSYPDIPDIPDNIPQTLRMQSAPSDSIVGTVPTNIIQPQQKQSASRSVHSSVVSQSVDNIDQLSHRNRNRNRNNNVTIIVNGSCACYLFNCILFVWSDFLMRVIPLWILSTNNMHQFILIFVVILWSIDIILYWRMIIKGKGNKLNRFLDVILFSWTGIISGTYFAFSTMDIPYVSSVVDIGQLSIEYWIRTLSSIIVVSTIDQISTLLSMIFIISVLLNLICGYKIYFSYCCDKHRQENESNDDPNSNINSDNNDSVIVEQTRSA